MKRCVGVLILAALWLHVSKVQAQYFPIYVPNRVLDVLGGSDAPVAGSRAPSGQPEQPSSALKLHSRYARRDLFTQNLYLSERRIDPETGEIQETHLVSNPVTGNVRVQIRESDSQLGFRQQEVTRNLRAGTLRSESIQYDPTSQTYDRSRTTYHPAEGMVRGDVSRYDSGMRLLKTDSQVQDIRSDSRAQSNWSVRRAPSQPSRPYVWPPLDSEQNSANTPTSSSTP